ncbi:DUF3048 domain-containing protein [Streptomyces sp. NPDC015171]|uniref:DUF3048 domain-containing protein n=1 Tax=Streptomyces sp. NPDC015171 TaxID=3364945 RepID=UPI003702E64C
MSAQSDHTNGVGRVGIGHWVRTRRVTPAAVLLAVTLTASLAAGCGGPGRDGDDHTPRHTPTRPGHASVAGSPLAVKIDNVRAARPQTGLGAADVVYVEQVEGGLSRLLAVYATRLPKSVGPVRSARESDLELLRQFHLPTLAFSGAQRALLPLIDRAPLRARSPDAAPGAYYRDTGRAAPHNLYLRPAALLPAAPGKAALTTGFPYGPAPAGGTPVSSRTVRYPAARLAFTWSAGRSGWLVSLDGEPALSTDSARPAPPTVVVQYVEIRTSPYHDVLGSPTPYTETVGSGRAQVLRDGRSFDASWSRPAASDGTAFTAADGGPMAFAAGQVWVVYAPAR